MVIQRAILIEVLPRGWIVLVGVVLGFAVFVALLVMLLVTGYGSRPSTNPAPTPTPGTCYPFCTAGPNTPPPGWN
ncbi:hypothetical protein [Nocardia macrotermitis]|uniref:Uncharacterized protein n=1 Tax=Nocardia macrotermitis TaxID=2585198 RepID=A0A7K0D4X1_9NOCA|nr:hypothetical protein [Nocardia macrotermitis]MQY19874.1 hypothetical protein [Nocardia macrotermitis]